MSKNRPPLAVIIILLLLVISAGIYFAFFANLPAAQAGTLTASGTVVSTNISIAPEFSGKVVEVNVSEGEAVKAGDVLFRLDDRVIKAQKDVATASLDSAKAAAATAQAAIAAAQVQYDMVYNAAMIQDKPKRTTDWYSNQPGEFTLPLWYYNQTEQLTATQAVVDTAKTALMDAQNKQASVETKATSADFVKTEGELAFAQASYEVANNLYNRVKNGKNIDDFTRRQMFLLARDAYLKANGVEPKWVSTNINQDLRDAAQTIFDDARQNLEDAQTAYYDAVTTTAAKDVLKARAQTSIAEEHYYTALDYARILQTGSQAQTVTAAAKALDQAKFAAAQAQTAINQAEANLTLLDAQLAKLVVSAPEDGLVMSRNVEPGEVVNPGSVVISLSRLSNLTITVYVPEDRFGEISLGQSADVSVDSFPGKIFTATVMNISDQAEFTPRNVQTADGRKTTVFAIKLRVDDPHSTLKAGMPADVVFK